MASESKNVILAALVGNALIAVTKFVAATMTGSGAMFSEGIHSVVDTGNQVLLLLGIKRASKPPDDRFPFGHGKEIYFWSFVVALLIFAVGSGISLFEGIRSLQHPHMPGDPRVNYIVLGMAMVFEGGAWIFAWRAFQKHKGPFGMVEAVQRGKDPSMFVVLFEDSAAMLGLVAAFLGVWLTQVTGNPAFDAMASIVIGLILGGTAVWLAVETKGLLIGESANMHVVEGIREIAAGSDTITGLNEVLTLHMGPDFILVNVSAQFADHANADAIEAAVELLDTAIKERFPRVKRVFIEAEALCAK